MHREISRRDFLGGAATLAVGGAAMSSAIGEPLTLNAPSRGPASASSNYPPMKTGIRGQDPAAMADAHGLRDGARFQSARDTGEIFDLIVVGAGLSGLAAAYYFRKQAPDSRILILEGCDDFGGQARRNEFNVNGRQLLQAGGSYAVQHVKTFPVEAQALLDDIGFDATRFERAAAADARQYRDMGLRDAMFFSKERFGAEKLVRGYPGLFSLRSAVNAAPKVAPDWADFLAGTPLSQATRAALLRIHAEHKDYMPGLAAQEKVQQLRRMSYADYLLNIVKVPRETMSFLQFQVGGPAYAQGGGPDSLSAWLAYQRGLGGFLGMGLPPVRASTFHADAGKELHLPDGNAGIARLLVRWLIPGSLAGTSMEDSIVPHVDYAALDRPSNKVRVRLRSTAIRARHAGELANATEVEVAYMQDGKVHAARAGAVVMACFNAIVPYLCPEMPDDQKKALHLAGRKPVVPISVAIRDWKAFHKLGVSRVICPGMFCNSLGLDRGTSLGGYERSPTPDEPTTLLMQLSNEILEVPGLAPRAQWQAARAKLLAIDFETFERNVRAQLAQVLSAGGFDPARDIEGIMVNRWAHGMAGGTNDLFDPEWPNEELPWLKGRRRFGRIAIANSDAAATALMQAAFQQANRAVNEIINDVIHPVFDVAFSNRG